MTHRASAWCARLTHALGEAIWQVAVWQAERQRTHTTARPGTRNASEEAHHLMHTPKTHREGKFDMKHSNAPAAQDRCSESGCHRRPARRYASGLCYAQHQELVDDRESDVALTDGRWVRGRHGIRVWQADKPA